MSKALAALGRFSATHRWVIILCWVVILGAFGAVTATSMNLSTSATGGMPETKASKALATVNDKFGAASGDEAPSLTLVLTTEGDEAINEPETASTVSGVLDKAEGLPHVASVSDPFDEHSPSVSQDRTTVLSTLTFSDLTETNEKQVYDAVLDFAESHTGEFSAEVGGELYGEDVPVVEPSEFIGVVIAFVVLLITFGSFLAAGANLFVAFASVGLGTVGVLAYSAITPLPSTIISLVTMLGLAVGIDYCLFIVSRFRSELKDGLDVIPAVERAVGTAGTAVVFAGLTVIIALAGLTVTGIGTIRDMGLAGAFGVLIAVLMSLTLLPVFLRTAGRKMLTKRERSRLAQVPGAASTVGSQHSFLTRWVSAVTRRPSSALIGAIIVLCVAALPMLSLKTALSTPGGTDPDSTQRAAYNLTIDKFGGIESPLLVLAEGPQVNGSIDEITSELTDLDHASAVMPSGVDDDAALFTVIPEEGPNDPSTKELEQAISSYADDISGGVALTVTGEAAINLDMDELLHEALIEYIVIIVIVSLLLMMVLFRSVLIPLVATLGYLLSLGVAFGASVAIFQWKWIPLPAPQGDPMLSLLPILLTGVLFGLAMDYQVFLVTRIQERRGGGEAVVPAIVNGFVRSAPVLVAAATIMAFVFAGFATSTLTFAASTAVGLTVGVIADAFVVRLIIMPAALALLGDAAWWMPCWLDRMLPQVDVEGKTLETTTQPSGENAEVAERVRE